MTTRPSILVVEDDPGLREWYEEVLAGRYSITLTETGRTALERYSEDVDVVLLDRKLSDMSGDEVLDELRDRDPPCQVIMVTGVEPDFDILSMPFDDYLVKPVTKAELHRAIDATQRRATYHERLQEYYRLVSKKTVLEAEKSRAKLDANSEYAEMTARINALESELDSMVTAFDDRDFAAVMRMT